MEDERISNQESKQAFPKGISIWLVIAICLAFGLRAFLLIDASTLWGDELATVEKSFTVSFSSMLAILREDTHPPAYYALL